MPSNTEILAQDFIKRAGEVNAELQPVKVLKARVYQFANSNVLIRAASERNSRYFFGINYITIEEMANLDNPFIAFICGSLERTIIVPAQILFKQIHKISHDRNGEYKINIDRKLNVVLKGRNKRLDCSSFINNWVILKSPPIQNIEKSNIAERLHSVLQGRLLEIGKLRGYHTYCPDKSKIFNEKPLAEIATLQSCPQLQFSDYDLLKQIDVLWFKEKGSNLIPQSAFEVELSTGTWSGVGRMSTLIDYSDVKFYVISNDKSKYKKVINTFPVIQNRFNHIVAESIGELYSSELQIQELRKEIGL